MSLIHEGTSLPVLLSDLVMRYLKRMTLEFWLAVLPIVGLPVLYLGYAQSKIVMGYEEARGGPLARFRGRAIGSIGARERLDDYHTHYRELETRLGEHATFIHEILTNAGVFWRTVGYEYYLDRVELPD